MTELGLARNIVRIVDHQPAWAILAAEAISELKGVSGVIAAEHVGSTSVPGLSAKPILDIAAGISGDSAVPGLTEHLVSLGYIYRGDGGEEGGHLFVRELAPDVRSIHLHSILHGGRQWRNYLLFRDTLRADASLRDDYAGLKTRLAAEFREDRAAYTKAKNDFIESILKASQRS
jgi:GrpB-like predicted nucleotidyltransferase (UPF0157 family)